MAARCSLCTFKLFSSQIKNHGFRAPVRFLNSRSIARFPNLDLSFSVCRRYTSRSLNSPEKSSESKNSSGQFLHSTLVQNVSSTGEKEEQQKQDQKQKSKEDVFRKKAMKFTFVAFGAAFAGMVGLVVYEWGSPLQDVEGNFVEDEFSHMPVVKAYIMRTYKEMMYYDKLIKEPSREKLLPEPLTEPYYQPPYTLVLEMTGILVHPDWTYKTGWRFKKRPGVDYFLQQIGPPLFEVVIYTAEQGFTAYPILDTLDPNGYIMYRLFRDATRYVDGHHIKDLSCLNRDLSKVILVDWDAKSVALQSNNAMMIKKWNGSDDDTTLYDLASLLRTIATSEIEDVRTVLEYYSQFDDPVAVYKENQRKLREEQEKLHEVKKGPMSSLVGSLSSNLRGRR